MVNGDEGNERGEKGMFGTVNDDGGDERGNRGKGAEKVVVIQFIIENNLQLQYCYIFHFLIKAIITTIRYYDNPPPRHLQDEFYYISSFGFPTYAYNKTTFIIDHY